MIILYVFPKLLDNERLSRKARAYSGLAVFFTVTAAAYIGELSWMYTRPKGTFLKANGVDWTDSRFAPWFIIFILFQLSIAVAPMYVSW
jgi:hypothetical protein